MAKDFNLSRKETQKLTINFLLVLIANVLHHPIDPTLISEKTHTSVDVINQNLAVLARKGYITLKDGNEVIVSRKQRIELIIFTLKQGCDIERICKVLGWREFEDLTAFILNQNSFEVVTHFRFKRLKKRYEIDVVGFKEPTILSVECKHWRRSWQRAATLNAVRTQVKRTRALAQFILDPQDRFETAGWRDVRLVPMLVTLSRTPYSSILLPRAERSPSSRPAHSSSSFNSKAN